MFNRLKEKWQVSWWQFTLIFITFATGGSLCGYLGRKILALLNIESAVFRIPIYIILVTLLWPACVLLLSIPFGQFGFFRRYIGRLGRRMAGKKATEHIDTK